MSAKVELPAPLVPPEVDLRDFPYMPLDVVRLRDSGLTMYASGDEFRAAELLWAASWHQIPAGSLPDDDDALQFFVRGAPSNKRVGRWKAIKSGALRGWQKCSDGRLYHPVVAEKALEAWKSRGEMARRGRLGAEKRWNNKDGGMAGPSEPPLAGDDGTYNKSGVAAAKPATASANGKRDANKGKGRENNEGKGISPLPPNGGRSASVNEHAQVTPDRQPELMALWPAGRQGSEYEVRQWTQRLVGVEVEWPELIDGGRAYIASLDNAEGDAERFCMALPTWLEKRRWTLRPPPAKVPWQPPQSADAQLRRNMIARQGRAGSARYPWKPEYGEPPTAAELMAARRAWLEHCVAWAELKAAWDPKLYGPSTPDNAEIEACRTALKRVAATEGSADAVVSISPRKGVANG